LSAQSKELFGDGFLVMGRELKCGFQPLVLRSGGLGLWRSRGLGRILAFVRVAQLRSPSFRESAFQSTQGAERLVHARPARRCTAPNASKLPVPPADSP